MVYSINMVAKGGKVLSHIEAIHTLYKTMKKQETNNNQNKTYRKHSIACIYSCLRIIFYHCYYHHMIIIIICRLELGTSYESAFG